MNIFAKKLKASPENLPIHPVELYETCPCKEEYRYLRGIQEEVLREWHEKRANRDTICKMNTGSGKTLTGLLMLYSKMIEGMGKAIYICPDKQLVEQAYQQGKIYGVPVCVFEDEGVFPEDFLNEKSILICNFSKIFNGKTIFNREKIELGSLLIDDAHNCLDKAREQTTIILGNQHPLYSRFLNLFKESLEFQAYTQFQMVSSGDPMAMMRVPYWEWIDKNKEIIDSLNEYREGEELKFKWNLVNEDLLNFDCFISGTQIEISPIQVPIYKVPSIHGAKHRFILSATFEDDIDLIKDLSISKDSILSPIVPKNRKDIGQRLILAPRRIDKSLTDEMMREFIKNTYVDNGENVVVIVPSFNKYSEWEKWGAEYIDKDNILKAIEKLKKSTGNFFVLSNRYDGVDLAGKMCCVLVIDGLPKQRSLREDYIETRLESFKHARLGQTVEQGLGRSVRSGADYSVIFLLDDGLVRFLGYEKNLEFFTPLTRAQIKLGLNLFDEESKDNPLESIKNTSKLCLDQDKSWREYHTQELSEADFENISKLKEQRLSRAEIETNAIELFRKRKYQDATDLIRNKILNDPSLTEKEQAWYFQFAAQLLNPFHKPQSNDLQIKASNITTHMFHPHLGHNFHKITTQGKQASAVIKKISEFSTSQDILIYVESILNKLEYSPDVKAKHFEKSLFELGEFLGFKCQMPESALGAGPDVLWSLPNSKFLILEAKSNSINDISKGEIEQLLHSSQWFKDVYGDLVEFIPVTLQRSNKKMNAVSPSEETRVLDVESLKTLKESVRSFANSLQTKQPAAFAEPEINQLLVANFLSADTFISKFLKSIK